MTDFADGLGADAPHQGASRGKLRMSGDPETGRDAPPTRFGRGWIPASRDIGLPGDGPFGQDAATPLASAGGERPTDDASAGREGDGVPHNGWSDARKVAFLHYLADRGDVRAACARVGMSRTSAYLLRRRDAVFAQGWSAALLLARAHAEEVLATRAIDGVDEAVWFRGELVGRRRRYDSRLLLAHLARLDRLAEQHHVNEQAGRFDEVLALLSGAAPDEDFFQPSLDPALDPLPEEGAPEPFLPLSRRDYVDYAPADPEGAGADWDAWQARACDHVDEVLRQARQERAADARDGHCVVAWDGWIGPGLDELPEDLAGEPAGPVAGGGDGLPLEYKSLDGPAACPPGPCKPCKPGGTSGLFRKIGWRRERIAGPVVIASEGRRGDAPTPLPPPRWPTFCGPGPMAGSKVAARRGAQRPGTAARDAAACTDALWDFGFGAVAAQAPDPLGPGLSKLSRRAAPAPRGPCRRGSGRSRPRRRG